MSEYNSIYELLAANTVNGRLPDDFSLPKPPSTDPTQLRWADGAMDGVSMYHMGFPKITDEQMQIIADAFKLLGDPAKVMQKMAELFTDTSPVVFIDAIQKYIMENTDKLELDKMVDLTFRCLSSKIVEMVKFGLIILEILSEPDDQIKNVVRTLGLSDEFTLFSVFNMMTWSNGNDEVFALAQKVHGWGRIHAVARLEPETKEIKDWLLHEGIINSVLAEYSALDVYEKVDISSLLKGNITDGQFSDIAKVLSSLFTEGPFAGMRAFKKEEAEEMLSDFLKQAEVHKTGDISALLGDISERYEALSDKCRELL
ncbi:MAG: hypothetical protein IKW96_06005 [Ruminococcus sp.]|uniref:hypothetical protein n=1 Tax=Ruminococcus sp. TaxID=41978 RepID=UPI0025E2D756|nr:hypothetical protein [Ruminococcus sp.]MBR5682815.1 hypothetical protein [Ruminococcus sp.]